MIDGLVYLIERSSISKITRIRQRLNLGFGFRLWAIVKGYSFEKILVVNIKFNVY